MEQLAQEQSTQEQYLTFYSAGAEYAIGILKVKEIIPYAGATKVPMAPAVIRGLINLRGRAVPVIDLAIKFGAPETRRTNRTCVIIVDVYVGEEEVVMGILTESVLKVIDLSTEEIDEAPNFGTSVSSRYLSGLAKIDENFVPIIDVETVLRPEEVLEAVMPNLLDQESAALADSESAADES